MPRVLETILRCYSGDCTDCPDCCNDTVTQPHAPCRNPAVPKVALEVALMTMGIGHSKARPLLSAIDLDPPACSGMHVPDQPESRGKNSSTQ
ncbi:hypothetical protein ACOMHN_008385 [Nucella lapillus]